MRATAAIPFFRLVAFATLCALLTACAAERKPGELFGPSEADVLVIDAILIVDRPLPDLFLKRTIAPGATQTAEALAVDNAQVVLSTGDATYLYTPDPDSLGRYLPPANAPIVQPERVYAVEASAPNGQILRAQTTTPERIQVQQFLMLNEETLQTESELALFSELGDGVFAAETNQIPYRQGLLEVRLRANSIPAYQLAIFNLEEDSPLLIEADFLEEDDLEEFERAGASPPLAISDGNARLPWFGIAFAGRHKFLIYALDKNWYDFVRTDPNSDGGGGGGLLGDQFQRPIFNVDGGIGFFASASIDSVGFTVHPLEP
jgi:hypothetical protein